MAVIPSQCHRDQGARAAVTGISRERALEPDAVSSLHRCAVAGAGRARGSWSESRGWAVVRAEILTTGFGGAGRWQGPAQRGDGQKAQQGAAARRCSVQETGAGHQGAQHHPDRGTRGDSRCGRSHPTPGAGAEVHVGIGRNGGNGRGSQDSGRGRGQPGGLQVIGVTAPWAGVPPACPHLSSHRTRWEPTPAAHAAPHTRMCACAPDAPGPPPKRQTR